MGCGRYSFRVAFGAAVLLPVSAAAMGPVISEFMAANATFVADDDGDFSDWIEIYNPEDTPVDLAQWALTDDPETPRKWLFPPLTLRPRGFLVVFASGKDRRDPGGRLHTNFKLASDGEHLALVDPDGQPASQLAPAFPEQLPDASYGLSMTTRTEMLLAAGSEARYLVPTDESIGSAWTAIDFDDSLWSRGPTGLGFDNNTEPLLDGLIATDVAASLAAVNSTLYLRLPFAVEEAHRMRSLLLRCRYADGFIAYINGVEVARANAPEFNGGTPTFDMRAATTRPAEEALVAEVFQLPQATELLRASGNVLAVHALARSERDRDFLFLPELQTVRVESTAAEPRSYFRQPTPTWPNGEGFPGVAALPSLSAAGGVFLEGLTLEITPPRPTAAVHITLDGSVPTEESPLYTEPLRIDGFALVKARTFDPGLLPSRIVAESYVVLGPEIQTFTSDLPLFVLNADGRVEQTTLTPGNLLVFDRGADGRTSLTGAVHAAATAVFKRRGSSTAGQPKPSLGVELRDARGLDTDVEILGFPPESDFVLYAAYDIDRTLMRNGFIYELYRGVGRYAVRTRFCEVFLNRDGAPLSMEHYVGVYSFMEKVKRGEERVDVEALGLRDNEPPGVSGGYMIKIDRLDPGDLGFQGGGRLLAHVYPKERLITPQQKAFIAGYMDDMLAVLESPDVRDPEVGYRRYIDPEAWIDFHLLQVLSRSTDGLGFSTYMFKKRGGRLEMGPVWDFDRSMSSTERAQDPQGFDQSKFEGLWWKQLFEDPWFWERYKQRWKELRHGPLSNATILGVLDRMTAEITEAQARNFDRWGLFAGDVTWEGRVAAMRDFIGTRADWIDQALVDAPVLNHPEGPVPDGFQLEASVPRGAIYYTLNGPDPRGEDGAPAPEALRYEGPIAIDETTTARVRTRIETTGEVDEGLWSLVNEATFVVDALTLMISEVMYDPGPLPDDTFALNRYKFLELENHGNLPIDLAGVRIFGADPRLPRFSFSDSAVTRLEPGAHAVVVANSEAFAARYGAGAAVAGEFVGNVLDRGSERLRLTNARNEPLADFTYDAGWHPSTAGAGHSLVLLDPSRPETARAAAGWRPSAEMGGSPGSEDPAAGPQAGLILPGDMSQDSRLSIADAILLLGHLVGGAPARPPCSGTIADSGNRHLLDADGNQGVDLADALYLLNYVFQRGPPHSSGTSCMPLAGCPALCSS